MINLTDKREFDQLYPIGTKVTHDGDDSCDVHVICDNSWHPSRIDADTGKINPAKHLVVKIKNIRDRSLEGSLEDRIRFPIEVKYLSVYEG